MACAKVWIESLVWNIDIYILLENYLKLFEPKWIFRICSLHAQRDIKIAFSYLFLFVLQLFNIHFLTVYLHHYMYAYNLLLFRYFLLIFFSEILSKFLSDMFIL